MGGNEPPCSLKDNSFVSHRDIAYFILKCIQFLKCNFTVPHYLISMNIHLKKSVSNEKFDTVTTLN